MSLQFEPPTRQGPTPIFEQVKGRLTRAIEDGELVPHERIPSERELSSLLGVSRMTVRQALVALVDEGALYTRAGKGTFVADRKIEQPLQRLSSFTEDMIERGLRPASRVLEQTVVPSPIDLAEALEIAPGAEIVRIARLRLADDEPLAIETAHLPHLRYPGLVRFDFSQHSLYDVLRTEYAVTLATARQTIEASESNAEEAAVLDLPRRAPVLRITRLTTSGEGRPVELVRAVYRGDRYQLKVELR